MVGMTSNREDGCKNNSGVLQEGETFIFVPENRLDMNTNRTSIRDNRIEGHTQYNRVRINLLRPQQLD